MNYFHQSNQIKKTISCILILVFAITTVYFNSLKGPFQYDDYSFQHRIWVSDLEQYKKRVNIFSDHGLEISSRPMVLFTYALNNTFGKNHSFGFHLLNLIFHVLTTIILFFVVRLAFQISRSFAKNGTSFALITSFVFAIHPALTETVTYISSRSSEMMTFFYMLGVWFFLQIFQLKKLKFREITIHALLIVLCFYFSIASKIVGATFPAALALLFIFLICPNKYPALYKTLTNRLFLFSYAVILVLSLAFALKFYLLDRGFELYGNVGYFCAQVKIIVFYYLKILFWPINLNADIGYPYTPPSVNATLILASLIGIGLIATAIFKGGQWAKICTGWFIFSLAPTSSILPLNDLAVERRVYLPAALGISPLFSIAAHWIPKNIRYVFLVFLLASFAILTAERNNVWNDELRLWEDALKKSPNSARPYANMGKALYEKGQLEDAEMYLKKSITKNYDLETTHYNLANIYMDKKQYNLAEEEYIKAVGINPLYYQAYFGLGSVRNKTGRLKEAEKSYLTALNTRSDKVAADEDYPIARINLGEVYGKMGRFEESIEQSEMALKSITNSFKAYYNIGTANMKLGRLEKAKESFLSSLNIKPDFENALFNLAFVYQKLKQFENSNKYFSNFLKIKKSFPNVYVSMGINYAQMNKLEQAASSFKKALQLNPKILNARTLLAKVLSQDGKNREAIEQLEIVLAQNPNLNAIRIQLGLMYWKSENQLERAKTLFETALKFSVTPKEKNQISYWLKELNK
jgi:tetratricopeptide (TPR) repeat protein